MKRALAGLLIGAAGIAASSGASAQNTALPYGCACLHNRTPVNVNFRYRWGDSEWRDRRLETGMNYVMCWRYKDAPKSPELLFQLDIDLTPTVRWETFSIKRAQSRDTQCSAVPEVAHYHVGYVGGSNRKAIGIYPGRN